MKHLGKIRSMASVYRQGSSIVSNLWIGSAGGHFEECELADARACVLRELFEELAIKEEVLENLSLRYVTIRYADNELRQNYYFFADLLDEQIQTPNSTEGITQWFSFEETGNLPMPFTAKYVVDHYIQTGQYSDTLYGGIANGDGVDFKIL